MHNKEKIWVIIPAAGVGKRMNSNTPKQYLVLNNKTILEHTLRIFEQHHSMSEVVVVISEEDEYWSSLDIKYSKPLHKVYGGQERCNSVLNGLNFLDNKAADDDWILVHDAARPCLRDEDLTLLLETDFEDGFGGILAIPVKDTMKRSSVGTNHIKETIDRENLWHALTPQMYRYRTLKNALELALDKNISITDEASAIEFAGYKSMLIEGHADNLKITRPEDLALAEFYLKQQKENL